MVTLRMIRVEAEILVHVESDDILERNFPRLVEPDKFLIDAEGRRARGQAQDEGCNNFV